MASSLDRHGGEGWRSLRSNHVLPLLSSGARLRRGRRLERRVLPRINRRCILLLMLFSLSFLAFLFFHDRTLQVFSEMRGIEFYLAKKSDRVRSRRNSSKRHTSCPIEFLESVDRIIEPTDYVNITRFSTQYVEIQASENPKFGGYQTLEEREASFHARNATVHCGFVKGPDGSPSTGFGLSEKDRYYLNSCKIAVSSCIFGSSDFLRRPTRSKVSAFSKSNVCFVMFLDESTLSQLASEGAAPDERESIGLWRIVLVRELPYTDPRKSGKVPKFLSHRLFPSASYSIWIDSKMRLDADPMQIIEYFLWRQGSEYAISNHYDRHCVWEEVIQNKRLNKYNHSAIDEQFLFYQSDGLVKFNDSNKDSSLLPSYVPEGSFIVRAHTPMANLFSCLWLNEVDRFTSRDQLSFGYTFLRFRRMNPGNNFFFHMFRDCERRKVAKLFHHRAESPPRPRIS